jgi:D-lactate dehydrogenase
MKILFYSVKDFEEQYLRTANRNGYEIHFTANPLSINTIGMAQGYDIISIFTGDDASAQVLEYLHKAGIKFIAVRAAGYDNVDINKASELGIGVANVPEYSPYAIAEHALAMMMALNRKLIVANSQVHIQDFTVSRLIGFDMHGKTIGIIGTGKIGSTLIRLLQGFGCRLIAYDITESEELKSRCGVNYVPLNTLCRESDIISIHTCLTPSTKYMINEDMVRQMKPGVMLINTSRGACVNTKDVIYYLKNGHIGYYGADVYEKEKGLFFYDWSDKKLDDPMLKSLLALPNVLITPHQAFATVEALTNIATTTFLNIFCQIHETENGNILTNNHGKQKVGASATDRGRAAQKA